MFVFTIICMIGFYLLTIHDSKKVKQVIWPLYGIIGIVCFISLFSLTPDTVTYVYWVRLFFLVLIIPVFILVVRKVWQLSSETTRWIQYTVSVPISILFILTLWFCWNMFPIFMYVL
ncbi:hypothetical protein [Fictibacillus norfolkensis]|uniref:Uncharacterized protein n=1 Tax=Fictibacillus norfolkensis TaxID=2762233 RepID=A0ABR8SH38_9BACL|nr:hypothetical protein [Fictibacillus norfolkensis]MBD7962787.1 hypothetical protein [Fictibacillus norfolkensis]